jgi:hypothetical protein
MPFVKILNLTNEVEAQIIQSLLREKGIAHVVLQNPGLALGGFFQTQFEWGWIEAEPKEAEAIREICADLRAPAGDDAPDKETE